MSPRRLPRLSCIVLVWLAVALLADRGEARPRYKSVFDELYPKVRENRKVDCTVCHCRGTNRKKCNHYGEALAKELGKKNVTDEKMIVDALKAIEDGECKTGKWRPRLQEGLLPCTCGCNIDDANSHISRLLERDRME